MGPIFQRTLTALLTAAMLLAQVPAGLIPDAISAFASAAPVLDQEQPTATPVKVEIEQGFPIAQTLTVGVSGRVVRIEAPVDCPSNSSTLSFAAFHNNGDLPGGNFITGIGIVGSAVNGTQTDWFVFDSSTNPPAPDNYVHAGDRISIRASVNVGPNCQWYQGPEGDPYLSGSSFRMATPNNFFSWRPISETNDDLPFRIFIEPALDLGASISTAPVGVRVGDTFTLKLGASNSGSVSGTGVSLRYEVPAGLRILSWSESPFSCETPDELTLLCAEGTLEPNGVTGVGVQVEAVAAGTHSTRLTAAAAEADPWPANNAALRTIVVADAPPPPVLPRIAYVYVADVPSRDSFVSFLSEEGFAVDVFDIAGVATADLSDYRAIVISDDSGDLSSWGTPAAVANIAGSGKRVVGVGEGGYAFFGRKYNGASNTIGWGNGAHGTNASVKVVNVADPAWTTPNLIDVGTGSTVGLYTEPVNSVEIFDEFANKGHRYIGQHASNARYYNVIGQTPTSCDVLWGFSGSPSLMTFAGKQLFENLLAPCPPQTVTVSAEVREDLNGDGDYDEGEPLLRVPRIEVRRTVSEGEPILVGSAVDSTNLSVFGIEAGTFQVVETDPEGYESTSPNSVTVTVAPGGSTTVRFMDRRASSLSGIARCGDVLLPGATVELLSGRVVVAITEANDEAEYSFSPVAANATYTVRITGFIWLPAPIGTEVFDRQFFTCTVDVTTGEDRSGTAPPGITIPNRLNHTWTTAFDVTEGGTVGAYSETLTDYVFTEGQSTWFKFPVRQGQHVTVNVTNLPADYSVTLYKDIQALYDQQVALLQGADPLANVDIIDGSVAPDALSPDALSPDALSPDALSPDALSPDALSPDALSPDALSPDALSPDALSPDALSPDALSPDALSEEVYASAQVAALIGVSAHVGLSPEKIARNTWSNSGYFYVRVRGHNGTFDASAPFTLTVTTVDSACAGAALPTFPSLTATTGLTGIQTVILTNSARLVSNNSFAQKLAALAAHPRVNGVVVDLAALPGVPAAYAQWDAARLCPAAANVIAHGIRDLVGRYRALYPSIQHVVLVGGDGVIPFFRTPDQSGLGNERDYAPPVLDDSASQASLKLGYVLTQDPYASGTPFSRFDHELYIPEIGIGRLVETPAQITPVIDAFLGSGGVILPQRALVTGYDFLSDAALAIAADLIEGGVADTDQDLIQPVGHGPTAVTAWTADQLRSKLLTGPRADIVALNGHFSANRALAADYATRFGSEEIGAVTDGRFVNTLVLSTGCHSGYNILDGHAVQGLTQPLDFPQAFALQGATLVGGTGYQYGDTDFIKYSELIHTLLVRELRYGTGPVNLGQALANAKRVYVSELASLRGIDEKAVAEATLYGLPMTAVDMAVRDTRPGTAFTGATAPLSDTLAVASFAPAYTLDRNEVTLTDLNGVGTSTAVYFDINDNVSVAPGTPVLPLLTQNVQKPGAAARGVVLLSAGYTDEQNVLPLTNVATTEVRGAHAPYNAEVFTPVRPVSLNHFAGTTLVTTPYQFRSNASGTTGTARTLTTPQYRIYYSSSEEANVILASSPVVYAVHLTPVAGGVRVDVIAGASDSVGIEELFATYTAESGTLYGSWQSLSLTAGASTTVTGAAGTATTYSGTIATAAPDALRVFVQAVAGNGLVSWATNNGAYYRVINESATAQAPKAPTALTLDAPASGAYLGTVSLSATLTSAGAPLAGRTVSFRSGDARIDAETNAQGFAQVAMPLGSAPGTAGVSVGFAEDAQYLASGAEDSVLVTRAATAFAPVALAPIRHGASAIVAVLRAGALDLGGQPITISAGTRTVASFTDGYGRVRFDTTDGFPSGNYQVTVRYAGNDRFSAASPLTFGVDIYVPSVNGGGWILTDGKRSNFSVNAGYRPGSFVPDGKVEFHDRVVDGLFRATSVTKLDAQGGIATIEGLGTWNGATGYRFRAVITDAATDRFEIQIFSGSTPIHSASSALGGGSVTVR